MLNAIRVTKTESTFDTIGFADSAINDLESLLHWFIMISENEFMCQSSKLEEDLELFRSVPFWFDYTKISSLSKWIVAHFEIRILIAYQNRHFKDKAKCNLLVNDSLIVNLYQNMNEKKKQRLFCKVIQEVEKWSSDLNILNSEKNHKNQNEDEKIFILIHKMDSSYITNKDKRGDKVGPNIMSKNLLGENCSGHISQISGLPMNTNHNRKEDRKQVNRGDSPLILNDRNRSNGDEIGNFSLKTDLKISTKEKSNIGNHEYSSVRPVIKNEQNSLFKNTINSDSENDFSLKPDTEEDNKSLFKVRKNSDSEGDLIFKRETKSKANSVIKNQKTPTANSNTHICTKTTSTEIVKKNNEIKSMINSKLNSLAKTESRHSSNSNNNSDRQLEFKTETGDHLYFLLDQKRRKYKSDLTFLNKCLSCKLLKCANPVRFIMIRIAIELETMHHQQFLEANFYEKKTNEEKKKKNKELESVAEEPVECELVGIFDFSFEKKDTSKHKNETLAMNDIQKILELDDKTNVIRNDQDEDDANELAKNSEVTKKQNQLSLCEGKFENDHWQKYEFNSQICSIKKTKQNKTRNLNQKSEVKRCSSRSPSRKNSDDGTFGRFWESEVFKKIAASKSNSKQQKKRNLWEENKAEHESSGSAKITKKLDDKNPNMNDLNCKMITSKYLNEIISQTYCNDNSKITEKAQIIISQKNDPNKTNHNFTIKTNAISKKIDEKEFINESRNFSKSSEKHLKHQNKANLEFEKKSEKVEHVAKYSDLEKSKVNIRRENEQITPNDACLKPNLKSQLPGKIFLDEKSKKTETKKPSKLLNKKSKEKTVILKLHRWDDEDEPKTNLHKHNQSEMKVPVKDHLKLSPEQFGEQCDHDKKLKQENVNKKSTSKVTNDKNIPNGIDETKILINDETKMIDQTQKLNTTTKELDFQKNNEKSTKFDLRKSKLKPNAKSQQWKPKEEAQKSAKTKRHHYSKCYTEILSQNTFSSFKEYRKIHNILLNENENLFPKTKDNTIGIIDEAHELLKSEQLYHENVMEAKLNEADLKTTAWKSPKEQPPSGLKEYENFLKASLFGNLGNEADFIVDDEKPKQDYLKASVLGTVESEMDFIDKVDTTRFKTTDNIKSFSANLIDHNLQTKINTVILDENGQVQTFKVAKNKKSLHLKSIDKLFYDAISFDIQLLINKLSRFSTKLTRPRLIVKTRLNQIIQDRLNTTTVKVQEFGSFATGLLTPFSDLDLTIRNTNSSTRDHLLLIINLLQVELMNLNFVIKQTPILTASIPILKLELDPSIEFRDNKKSTISFIVKTDVIVEKNEENEIKTTPFRTTEFIKCCVDNEPTFYEVILVLKYALSSNGLSNSYTGFIIRRYECLFNEFVILRIRSNGKKKWISKRWRSVLRILEIYG